MSALVPTNVQLPSHLTGRIGAPSNIGSSMTAGLGGASFKRISKRGSRFRIRDGSQETVLPSDTLRCVIVGASPNVTKLFYKGPYNAKDKDEDKKPDCYSNDGIRPGADAEDPQSQLCANCAQNQWGSRMSDSGNRMKACADQKRLAIISADDNSPEPEVYLYTVTPSELMDFRNYGKQLESKGFPPELVVTELSFDTSQSYPKIQFKFGGFVDEGMVSTIDGLVGTPLVREITGEQPVVAQVVNTPEPPKPSPIKIKEEPKYVAPPVIIEDAEYEDITPAEPKKPTKGFGAAPAAKPAATPVKENPPAVSSSSLTADIQDILASMQDEDDD